MHFYCLQNNPVMQTACSDKLSDAIKDKENATNVRYIVGYLSKYLE